MATYTKSLLSGSTSGRGIKVAATATPGTTIHTAVAGAAAWDEIWLYAFNSNGAAETLTIQWGGTTNPDDYITVTVPALCGLVLVIAGLLLNGGLVVKAFANDANVVTIHGYVNKIT